MRWEHGDEWGLDCELFGDDGACLGWIWLGDNSNATAVVAKAPLGKDRRSFADIVEAKTWLVASAVSFKLTGVVISDDNWMYKGDNNGVEAT